MKLALAQMKMSQHIEENLSLTVSLIHEAAERGADLICFPEIQLSPFFPQYEGLDVSGYLLQEDDPAIQAVQAACRENQIYASPNFYLQYSGRCYDTSLLINNKGELIGRKRWSTLPSVLVSMNRIIMRHLMRAFRFSKRLLGESGLSSASTGTILRVYVQKLYAARILF